MSDFVFNAAKGKVAYYATLPASSDALVVVPLLAAGIEADPALKDYADLAALLGGSTDEQTTLGRKTISSGVTVTVNNISDFVDVDMPDLTWTNATGAPVAALVICYDGDTTSGTDANLLPLVKLDCAFTPDGSTFTAVLAGSGFYRAT